MEKADDAGINESKNERMMRKMLSGKFDLLDMMESMEAMKGMGTASAISKMLPGATISDAKSQEAEQKMADFEVLLNSMTEAEKKNPTFLKHPKRRDRILKGSGKGLKEFNILTRDFDKAKKQMKEMAKYIKAGKMPGM